jgi:hypothetical protein
MGLAGYKGTKEANGTSYIPIARAVSEARTEATPATKRSEAPQGHKRAISSTEDAVDSDAKKARLNSLETRLAGCPRFGTPSGTDRACSGQIERYCPRSGNRRGDQSAQSQVARAGRHHRSG